MNKKAQTHQIFFYIMIIIVIGAVTLIGYTSISKMMTHQCNIEKLDFKDDLTRTLESQRTYGQIKHAEMRTPCQAEQICFINQTVDEAKIEEQTNTFIKAAAKLEDPDKDNIFIQTSEETIPLAKIQNMQVPEGILCIPSQGSKFYIKIESIGYGQIQITQSS